VPNNEFCGLINLMKNSLFQSVCLGLDTVIPRRITKTLYYPSFLIFQILCKFHFSKNLKHTYLRNSFFLNYCVFGLSDYDFGIVLKTRASVKDWNCFYQNFKRLKFIFPFWGEINLYCEDEIDDLVAFINPIELKRDPYLSNKFKLEASPEEKFVFLSRSLSTNFPNWKFEQKKRFKFSTYFDLCQMKYSSKTDVKEMLESNLYELLQTPIQKNYIHFIIPFQNLLKNSPDILWEPSSSEVKVLFPQHYLWFEREEGNEEFLGSLSESDKRVLVGQLNWEIWGLMTQLYTFEGKDSFVIHLNRIKKVFTELKLNPIQIQKIEKFLAIYNTIQ